MECRAHIKNDYKSRLCLPQCVSHLLTRLSLLVAPSCLYTSTMKFTVAAATFAVIASVSAQMGPVDPAKLPLGWCMTYTEDACRDTIAPKICGANSTWTTDCKSTFS